MRDLGFGVVIGVLVAIFGVTVTGYTSAIAAPIKLFQILDPSLGSLIWDVFVVQLLGFGVLSLVFAYFTVKQFALTWLLTVVVAFVSSQVVLYVMNGMETSPVHQPMDFLPHLLVLVTMLSLGGYWGAREKNI